jgi:hypothetical protein
MFASNGNGSAEPHFDNVRLEQCISRLQAGDTSSLGKIIELSQNRALALIRFNGTSCYAREDELLSDVNYKLLRAIAKFDPAKGTAFTYVSRIIDSALRTRVTFTRKQWSRHTELNDEIASQLHTNGETESRDSIDDLADRLKRGVKTTVTEEAEQDMQRWFVDSFIAGAFELRRHQCCDAAMAVHRISHERSRELYDLTLLACRQVMFEHLHRRQAVIAPGQLNGTRAFWMTRYAHLLDAEEFTRFVTLTRNLNPFIVLLIAPGSRSRRLDRNPTVSRTNLLWVLNGHPGAVPLF